MVNQAETHWSFGFGVVVIVLRHQHGSSQFFMNASCQRAEESDSIDASVCGGKHKLSKKQHVMKRFYLRHR
jgi:hypothetical protein